MTGGGYHKLSFVHIQSIELGNLKLSQEVLANNMKSYITKDQSL